MASSAVIAALTIGGFQQIWAVHPWLVAILGTICLSFISSGATLLCVPPRRGPDKLASTIRQALKEREIEGFVQQVTDADYIRGAVPTAMLPAAEKALRRATVPGSENPEMERFLEALDRYRISPLIWRSDFVVNLKYEHPEAGDEHQLARIETQVRYRVENHTGRAQPFTFRIVERMEPIEGLEVAQLFELNAALVGGADRLAELSRKEFREGGKIFVEHALDVTLPIHNERSGKFECGRTSVLRQANLRPWVLTFFMPVRGLRFRVQHPRDIDPELYVFGIPEDGEPTDPLRPSNHTGDFHEWDCPGWFLPNQGAILIFSET